jgi:transporter family protein
LIALSLWGAWGVVLKIASSRIPGWKNVYIATNSAIILVMVLIAISNRGNIDLTPSNYLIGFAAGLMGTLGYIFLVLSLEAGGKASIVVALTGVYPALTAILSRYILKESLTVPQWIGVFLAVVAVILLSYKS